MKHAIIATAIAALAATFCVAAAANVSEPGGDGSGYSPTTGTTLNADDPAKPNYVAGYDSGGNNVVGEDANGDGQPDASPTPKQVTAAGGKYTYTSPDGRTKIVWSFEDSCWACHNEFDGAWKKVTYRLRAGQWEEDTRETGTW